jgi:arylsulfatase A
MKHHHILAALIVFTALLSVSCKKEEVKPNIILILADDQGWGATSVVMDPSVPASASDFIRTPNLERLAARGMVFSSGYAPHPNCSPSRAAILTGKSPAQLHLTDIVDRHSGPLFEGNRLIPPPHVAGLDTSEITIAELIKRELPGYATAHFGKWHLAAGGPEKHGFDVSHGETSNREGDGNPPDDPKKIFTITRDGMDWMESMVTEGRSFYLQLSHYATHLGIESRPETLEEVSQRNPGHRHTFVPYAAMSEDLDTGVGMILDKIEELGIADKTYVIYLADNGTYPTPNPANINGPLHGWKATLWEGGIRVPFIIAGPGISAGYQDIMVTGCDLYPTICDWVGIRSLPDGVEGKSLAGILAEHAELPENHEVSSTGEKNGFQVFHFPHYQHQKGNHPVSAIYQDSYKLIKWYEDTTFHLYSLEDDLEETHNLAGEKPDVVLEMDRAMKSYFEEIGAWMPTLNPDFSPASDPALQYPGVKERLMEQSYFITK